MADPARIERADTGTVAQLAVGEIYRRARRIQSLALIAMECSAGSSARDPVRARQLLAKIGAIAGTGASA